jgi:hypothetical protein
MSRKFIEETVDRINELMERNVSAKTYQDLSYEDNQESMDLVSRIEEIAEAMHLCRLKGMSCEERELYAFVKTISDGEIALFKHYLGWFRRLSTSKEI